jgi:hypothetical protein
MTPRALGGSGQKHSDAIADLSFPVRIASVLILPKFLTIGWKPQSRGEDNKSSVVVFLALFSWSLGGPKAIAAFKSAERPSPFPFFLQFTLR